MPGTFSEHPIITAPKSLGRHDIAMSGKEMSCGVVDYVATNTSFAADPLNWHQHLGYELLFMLRGTSGYQFEDGEKMKLTGGHFMVIPPRSGHRGVQNIREPSTICAIVLKSRRAKWTHNIFTPEETAWIQTKFSAETPQIRSMTPAMRQTAKWLHETMVRHSRSFELNGAHFAHIRLQAALLILQAAHRISDQEQGSPTMVIERAKTYLVSRYAEPFTIDQLTAHTDCSRTRLFQAFKRQTGMTPVDWLQRFRVGKALELFQTTNRTLDDIATAVGLTSGAYLCNTVKRYTGRTPGQHRKAAAKG
jgi:AraC-like DNA-binding protein